MIQVLGGIKAALTVSRCITRQTAFATIQIVIDFDLKVSRRRLFLDYRAIPTIVAITKYLLNVVRHANLATSEMT
jgi:hypothetical protein